MESSGMVLEDLPSFIDTVKHTAVELELTTDALTGPLSPSKQKDTLSVLS